MTDGKLSFSIDLDAELRSMTERQHLNAVHFTVQLVRHALRHAPTQINLVSTKASFRIEHDGAPFDDDERQLLFDVLDHSGTRDPSERQKALASLEQRFGVDLLGIIAQHARVRVSSTTSFEATAGTALKRLPTPRTRGVEIVVDRKRVSARQERKELKFYARYADARVRLNGKRLNQRQRLDDQALAASVVTDEGRAQVGLPRSVNIKRVRYYKHGVYFGVRTSVPADGLVSDAIYNSTLTSAEDNFRDSLRVSVDVLRTGRDRILDLFAQQADHLPTKDFRRAKQLVLQLKRSAWTDALCRLQMFDAVGKANAYSLIGLQHRANGVLFYAPTELNASVDSHLPQMTAGEAAAVSKLLRVPCRPALAIEKRSFFSRLLRRGSSSTPDEGFPLLDRPAVPSPEVQALARQLHIPGVFTLAFSDVEGVDRSLSGARVRLRPTHPHLLAMATRPQDETTLEALRVHVEALANANAAAR